MTIEHAEFAIGFWGSEENFDAAVAELTDEEGGLGLNLDEAFYRGNNNGVILVKYGEPNQESVAEHLADIAKVWAKYEDA